MMNAIKVLPLSLMLLTGTALAQSYTARYTINGQYDLVVDGVPMQAFTTYDAEKSRSSVDRHKAVGKVFYNVNGSQPKPDGTPRTIVSVQLWPDHVSDIQYIDAGMFGADVEGGEMSLDAPPLIAEDGSLAFAFHGRLVQFEIKDGTFTPVPAGRVVEISGSYKGQFPVE